MRRWRLCPGSLVHLLRCMLLRLCPKRQGCRLPLWMSKPQAYLKLLLQSLFYNTLTDSDVIFESLFEPLLWIVDYLTRWFGLVFVWMVVILTSSILLVVYVVLLPNALRTYTTAWLIWHLCYGHWNIVMIVFHYYKAVKTAPGYPPSEKNDIPFVSVCKKCVLPKPARTHHCSICNRCILKMDHHCPWLNNCVGHLNHRYFFSFCVSMTLGCIYCSVNGRTHFLAAYYALEHFKHLEVQRAGVRVTGMGPLIGLLPTGQTDYVTPAPPYTFKERIMDKSIIYMWVLTSTVAVVLGALTTWHALLISRGETSIEMHTNSKERSRMKKMGQVYKNPFNYGKLQNWKIFLGVEKRSHWFTRVLLPSAHLPLGDGLTWDSFPVKKEPIPV
ncbi:palmitoyltransferase ZDHHC16A isoform X1 [Syngnathus scovelli]|uniref:palmitoyltransferase ZDHHC16A isoform X1 n=1 Tax=Syngnathus scovelli TaxID=161590 RepID=UPI00210F77B8|nr:palmitoyltransferase ZDHHC16A isoform X1 [Syngnathus scovelli]XP_049591562.1 palmitoyltransferase ZDHHC16A isoform X1 [Syngnathus scovelli]XP_049591563.1 palmitoyltransferase ZDHHC16A isoform X1 [Syngnathus scovelli]